MDAYAIAHELRRFIEDGEYREVCLLLNDITDPDVIEEIEFKFLEHDSRCDPLNFAILNRQESIAIYLVEKGFRLDRVYQWPDQQCDQWCYFEHGVDQCSAAYTAADRAGTENLYRLKNHIDEIQQGKKKRGQSLPVQRISSHPSKTKDKSKIDRMLPNQDNNKRKLSDDARDMLNDRTDFRTYARRDTGDTLLHENVRKPNIFLYVLANAGVPVNIQNNNGDTALHIAVREGLLDAVEALLQCSADITMKNKFGRTPWDEADNKNKPLKNLLSSFKHGVIPTIAKGKSSVLDQLFARVWCSTSTYVKKGKTLIEWAESTRGPNDPCVRKLKEFHPTSKLIHAVLCDDVLSARDIIENSKNWNVNARFRDHRGKTLLSQAVELNNLELVKLLVENGAKFEKIRVREGADADITVPLFQKAIHQDINLDIAKYLNLHMLEKSEHSEKDCNGNTAILRAIDQGCSATFVSWLIHQRVGYCLQDRNKDGLTPKELAISMNREDVVKEIDKYIREHMMPNGILKFPTHFWREKHVMLIKDEVTDKTIKDIIKEIPNKEKKEYLTQRLNFHDIQNSATRLFEAASTGAVNTLEKNYDCEYQDKNGYTVLIRAIAFQQLKVCKHLCTTRPTLLTLADNCNRYPLHYAYTLPDKDSKIFVDELLKNDPDIDKRVDKDGRLPAEYKDLKKTVEMQKMLYHARILDPYGKPGPPLGPWPEGASTSPPDKDQPMDYLDVY